MCKRNMNNELQNTDTQQETLMKEINQGERNIRQVDWVTFLSDLIKAFRIMKKPVSPIGWVWALIGEIDEPTKRMELLSLWQDAAPKCFPTKEESDEFIASCDCLVRINSRLRHLYISESAQLPHTYDGEYGGKGLNELAVIWADNHVYGEDLVALASEIHRSVMEGMRPPLIEQVLLSSRNYGHLAFDNIYDFSRNLFLAESFRTFLLEGKANSDVPMTFVDLKRKIRNACFDEYIRMRLAQIESEMENDNSLLLDPTIDDMYQELYSQERSVVDREFMFETFRGSQAYRERWYRGRPDVLQMMKYFMDYLNWKMENLHDVQKQPKVIVNNGDYVAGNKYTGTVIEKVEAGGIGVQQVYYPQGQPSTPPSPRVKSEPAPETTQPRGPKLQYLFADENRNENIERTSQEAERVKRYIADHRMGNMRLDSTSTNQLNLLVACFYYEWRNRGWVSQEPKGAAIHRFLTEQCQLPCDVTPKAYARVIVELIKGNRKDYNIEDNLRSYF